MRILSLGAGVQSSTLALMSKHGYVEPFDAAIFADTQNEPAAVMTWLDWLETQLPYPVYRVTAGNLASEQLRTRVSKKTGQTYIRTLIPAFIKTASGRALLGRKCTAEYKVRALLRKQRELGNVPRGCKVSMMDVAIGISLDEYQRMKPSIEPWATNYWPLIDLKMTRQDCVLWMERHGYPKPPRSACIFCPFHSDDEWMRLRAEDPYEFQKAKEFDDQLRVAARKQTGTAKFQGDVYLHSSLKPLSEVQFGTVPAKAQVDMFNNECEGLCGV